MIIYIPDSLLFKANNSGDLEGEFIGGGGGPLGPPRRDSNEGAKNMTWHKLFHVYIQYIHSFKTHTVHKNAKASTLAYYISQLSKRDEQGLDRKLLLLSYKIDQWGIGLQVRTPFMTTPLLRSAKTITAPYFRHRNGRTNMHVYCLDSANK